MKIKKAFDLCKRSGEITTYIVDDEQWLSSGTAAWPLSGVPELSEEYICQLYDIDDNKREKIVFRICNEAPERIDFRDAVTHELPAQPLDINVVITGQGECIPMIWEGGLILINREYLKPLSDLQEEDISYWIRFLDDGDELLAKDNKSIYVAVKVGLLIYAIIMPVSPSDSFFESVQSMYTAAKATV